MRRSHPRRTDQSIRAWQPVMLWVLFLAGGGTACPKHRIAAQLLPLEERFVVGVEPRYCAPALLGEAPRCCATFTASDVIAIEAVDGGVTRPKVVREGRFAGTCGGQPMAFEGVRPGRIEIEQTGGHVGLAPFELDVAHADWDISLSAAPLDRAGARLSTGASEVWFQGLARWKMRPGCERVVRVSGFDGDAPGRGFAWPADTIRLLAVRPGSCTLEVDYSGARREVKVTVR
jgi:hypothetical protein